jgi:predicted P-loop ATPase
VKDIPRCCVFFGTTNTAEFLRDRTGNRRFWPIDTGVLPRKKSIWRDLDGEINQLWAEAVLRWRIGELLYLTGAVEEEAKVEQEQHREKSSKEGVIADFVEQMVPEDWQKWPLDKRRMFLGGTVRGEVKMARRDRVCALEIWCEAFGGQPKDFRYTEAAEINDTLRSLPEWEKTQGSLRFGYCGPQRGFQRKRE